MFITNLAQEELLPPEERQRREEAAKTIQQAYRNYRAYKLAEDVHGVNPYKDSAKNLKRLKDKLAENIGLSEEEKLAKGKNILTKAEEKLVDVVINQFPWTLKHATSSYEAVVEGGNQLLSLRERKRLAGETKNSHTLSYEGNDDNVFFTLGSPKHALAGFVNQAAHTITVDLKKYLNKENKPEDALKGLWYGDHWFPYFDNARYACKLYGSTKRVENHDQGNIYEGENPTKTYEYIRKDGSLLERTVALGEETVSGRDIPEFIALNLVQELRYIGDSYREKLLNNPSLENIEPAIDIMFNSNIFEAKLPVKLQLDKKYITITENKKQDNDINTPKNAHLFHKAVKRLDYPKVEELLKKGIDPDIIHDDHNALLFIAKGGKDDVKMAKLLIKYGADISLRTGNIGEMSPYHVALRFNKNPDFLSLLLDSAVPDIRDADIKKVVDVNERQVIKLNDISSLIEKGEFKIIDLLITHGLNLKIKDNSFLNSAIKGLFDARNNNLAEGGYLELIDSLAPYYDNEQNAQTLTDKPTPIMVASQLGLADIIEKLAKAGHNTNQHAVNKWLEIPETALMQAVQLGQLNSVKKLLELGVDIEEKDEYGRTAYYIAKSTQELTYEQFKSLPYDNEKKSAQEYREIVNQSKKIASYLKSLGAKEVKKQQVLNYDDKENTARVIVKGKDKDGTIKYLIGKEVLKEGDSYLGYKYGDAKQNYSFPKTTTDTIEPIATLAGKALFENTLVKSRKFSKEPKTELHEYDKVSSKLRDDKYNVSKINKIKRTIDNTLLYDVGDINQLKFNEVDGFKDIKWVSAKEAQNLNIEKSDRLLLDKAINPQLNLKNEIDQIFDRKYDGANQLINKLLVGDPKGLFELLDQGYDINALNPGKFSVIQFAAAHSKYSLLEILVRKYGADVNQGAPGLGKITDDPRLAYSCSILEMAILKDDLKLAQFLVQYGADVNKIHESKSQHYINLAVKRARDTNNMEILDFLFAQGATIPNSFNYMIIGSCGHNTKLINYIIDKGANLNDLEDKYGTPLSGILKAKNLNIAKLLIEKGADVNTPVKILLEGYYDNHFEYAKKILGEGSAEYRDFANFASNHEAKKVMQEAMNPNINANNEIVLTDMEVDKSSYIYLATASSHLDKEGGRGAGSGDIDYTKTLEESLKKALGQEDNVNYLFGINDEKKIFEHIEQNTPPGAQKVLHMMVNAPSIGFAFSEEGLKKFKDGGGIIVATAIEFASRNAAPNLKPDTLKYLSYADQVIFLDENDKKEAIKYQQLHNLGDKTLYQKLLDSQIINVPPTVPVSNKNPEERGKDIISFGMIRTGKGFAHVRKLAELIEESNDPLIKDKKILVVGTVQKDKISRDGRNYNYDGELYKLMKDIYPNKVSELQNKNPKELKELHTKYQQENVKPAIPIELYLDVPKEDLPQLFDRCSYSFLPAYRGATLRNSSISSSLANKFITYSHIGKITPKNLKQGGEYNPAMILQANDDFHNYADNVLINISSREHNPKLNKKTWEEIHKLSTNELDPSKIATQHIVGYSKAIKRQRMEMQERFLLQTNRGHTISSNRARWPEL